LGTDYVLSQIEKDEDGRGSPPLPMHGIEVGRFTRLTGTVGPSVGMIGGRARIKRRAA